LNKDHNDLEKAEPFIRKKNKKPLTELQSVTCHI